jgi:hypothetical protein
MASKAAYSYLFKQQVYFPQGYKIYQDYDRPCEDFQIYYHSNNHWLAESLTVGTDIQTRPREMRNCIAMRCITRYKDR